MTRTAFVHVSDGNGATTSVTYPIPDYAVNESIQGVLDIGLNAHFEVHGDEQTEITASARFFYYEEEDDAADEVEQ